MPHLYLHIPFCKQACHYCDFHFSTSQKNRRAVVDAMMLELEQRKNELPGSELQTIYFGGGTPSILSAEELKTIFENISRHFTIAPGAEITLEANPDDLSEEFLQMLKQTPVNRLSIGIQSFRDEDLKLMNRVHSAQEAIESVQRAKSAGFENLTIDLIYGIPGLSEADWKQNLEKAFSLGVQHLSAYCLTVEPRTTLAHLVKTGKIKPVDEEAASAHFEILRQYAAENGFEQYEISNFAREGFIAKHNSSYWFGEPYLGIGPSAHSYHDDTRRWNISNNTKYVNSIMDEGPAFIEEKLTAKQQFNEHLLTHLRTKWGVSAEEIEKKFGEEAKKHFENAIAKWMSSGHVILQDDIYTLSGSGKLLADHITAELFL